MSDAQQIRWLFGPFELAPARGRLSTGGSEIALARKSFEVLVHLIIHRERVVSKDEILATVPSFLQDDIDRILQCRIPTAAG